MSATVTIAGVAVAIDDPCAIAAQLKVARLSIVLGETVSMSRVDQEEVQFSPANLKQLDAAIADYESQCARKSGAVRRRARSVRWN